MNPYLHIAPEVATALHDKQPVVALESTLITHGLPYPSNVETATQMEAAVRAQGAIPATVAVLKGKLTVGIGAHEIERLGALPTGSIRKCSRRDLAIAAGLQEDAATTVAGTMIAAHMVGISVFATGGIGGVHRGAPYDVSADLIELGRTPVAVVCGGAKSILDLPLTLEVLETQGVPVIGYQSATLPAFYSRSSGLPVDAQVDTPEAAARIIRAAQDLDMQHGIIFGVPVPQADELPEHVAEAAIQQATIEAAQQGIHGKAVTPFVLGRVLELTGGESKRANVSLLINNAAVGGTIAAALSRLG
jgi:pseudouridine-5'-phosphate glycosidase